MKHATLEALRKVNEMSALRHMAVAILASHTSCSTTFTLLCLCTHLLSCAVCRNSGGGVSNPMDMMNMTMISPPTSDQLQCISDEATNRATEIVNACGNTDLSDVRKSH